MKYITKEKEIEGERTDPPYARCLKHLVTPWTMGARNLWVGMSIIDVGSSSNPHSHENEEVFYVLSGKGEVKVGSYKFEVESGTCILIPSGATHQLTNKGKRSFKVLAVVSPPFLLKQFESVHRIDKKQC